ncbi:beta-ketoacyl synthase N-terminal-like domain-containing protein [Terrimonas rubra]|uniref:Beta-ketoacyl synthase N-terminal-like domain-containing protein n=1 Tax=Terrimonas rubra TaxID=1035890 RepID=A0ABW6A1D8_9BACT
MQPVYITGTNIITPIASTTAANFDLLAQNVSGVQQHHDEDLLPVPFYASLFSKKPDSITQADKVTRFEQLLIDSVADAVKQADIDTTAADTALIISTTKGNISLIEGVQNPDPSLQQRVALHRSANIVQQHFGFIHTPVVVSHACISGLVALITGMRLIQAGKYRQVVVTGADIITQFVLSGFHSFMAISDQPCQPFDANRKGINLGEGAATIILSAGPKAEQTAVQLMGGAVSNDANHISGPSRTGAELYQAISEAMQQAGVSAGDIDFISAHGTATRYNDDMESKAITLANLQQKPVNSLKGYYGHTLGAAGLIETAITVDSLLQNKIIGTRGFEQPGTAENINVCSTLQPGLYKTALKTASGFGGCNAAIVIQKSN